MTAALAAIGGKWKLIILYWLAESPKHFAGVRRAMPGISPKVLAEQLQELVNDSIVQRDPEGSVPARVVYSLTDYGRSVVPLVESVRLWGRAHITRAAAETEMQASGAGASGARTRSTAKTSA